MREPITLSQVIQTLQKKGYVADFRAQGDELIILPGNIAVDPESLEVHEMHRFEGETDLDEEAIVFALYSASHQVKGTYLAAFGPKMSDEDSGVVQRLRKKVVRRGSR
jgi:hypothetical protein